MTNPFNAGSGVAKVFDMAAKGTTRDAINNFAAKHKLNGPRLFHVLRRESYGDQKWKYNQTAEGRVQLLSVVSRKASRSKTSTASAKKAA